MKKFLFLLFISLVASIQIKAFDTVRIVDTHSNLLVTLDTGYDTIPTKVFLGSIPINPSDTVELTQHLVKDPTTELWTVSIPSGKISKSDSLIVVYKNDPSPGDYDTIIHRYYHVYSNPSFVYTIDNDTIDRCVVEGQSLSFNIDSIDKLNIEDAYLIVKTKSNGIYDTIPVGSEITEFTYNIETVDTLIVHILITNSSGFYNADTIILNVLPNPYSLEEIDKLIADTIRLSQIINDLKDQINKKDSKISTLNNRISILEDSIATVIEININNAVNNDPVQEEFLGIFGLDGSIQINGIRGYSTVTVNDAAGATIYHNPAWNQLTISNLSSGVYIVRVGKITKKVIVT